MADEDGSAILCTKVANVGPETMIQSFHLSSSQVTDLQLLKTAKDSLSSCILKYKSAANIWELSGDPGPRDNLILLMTHSSDSVWTYRA